MILTPEQIAEFKEKGYLKYGRIYSDAEADALCKKMFDVMEGRGDGRPERVTDFFEGKPRKMIQIVNIWEADSAFYKHLFQPLICEIAAELMETDTVRVWHDQVQYKPPKIGGPTDWHQDHPYWPIIQPADLVSAWMALDDATIENGCMRMVTGSHKWGAHKGGTIGTDPETFAPLPDMSLLPEGTEIEVVPIEVKKGEVMFHHCLTWHGTRWNDSDRGRPGIAVHYMPGHTRYEPVGEHLVGHHVTVKPGEILVGGHFPTVWENGKSLAP